MSMNPSMRRPLLVALTIVIAMAMSPAQAAIITVTTVADAIPPARDGQCSLREALVNASNDDTTYADCPAGTGDDEIAFASSLFRPANQYTATIHLVGMLEAGKVTGTAHALAIRPPSSTSNPRRVRLVASDTLLHRVMDVLATATPFTLERINIEGGRGGSAGGGGIRLASQHAHFEAVHFIDNQADSGGALYQAFGDGELQINNSVFQGNRALQQSGGAIALVGTQPAHRVFILDTHFTGNSADLEGGAIVYQVAENFSGPDIPLLDIVRSRFVNNSSDFYGGSISARATSNANQRLRLRISDSLFQGNQSNNGGGLYVIGHPLSSLSSVNIQRSSFIDNQATDGGGGIAASNLDMHIENSLFAGNYTGGIGGSLFQRNTKALTLIGNSFHRQTQPQTSVLPGRTLALDVTVDASGWEWTFSGNLFHPAASSPIGRECAIIGGSTQPPTLQGGDNLSPDADCLFLGAADIQGDPMVEASDSGDPLKPMLLLPQPGSPAIDAWPAEACTNGLGQPLTRDLRDATRPTDGDGSGIADCDIGAFELPALFIFANGFEG